MTVTSATPNVNAAGTPNHPKDLPPCDLVMKGGITSGVVYPKLIARLARDYRFKSVGGTSAGAIAAAACVAAEFGRQSGAKPDAFERLAELPRLLGDPVADGSASKLLHLFQPAPALRDHFAVLVGSLNAKSKFGAVAGALRALMAKFWPLTLLALLAALLLIVPAVRAVTALHGLHAVGAGVLVLALWLLALSVAARSTAARAAQQGGALAGTGPLLAGGLALVALVSIWGLHAAGASWLWAAAAALACAVAVLLCTALALALASGRFVLTLLAGMQGNFWGLCSGRTVNAQPQSEGLTDWLTVYLNGLAGVAPDDRPLTFGDLWAGRRDDTLPAAGDMAALRDTPARQRELNLQVMTTAVSQQMSYSIPLRDNADAFYYEPEEWARLFPASVMQWLERSSRLHGPEHSGLRNQAGKALRRLPANRHWPVVVAVRMSLSFPVLLAAVPLYARDLSLLGKTVAGQPTPSDLAKRVWFSDGGISSNMPLHMFDAPLPGRPTFAVNLKGEHPAYPIDPKLAASAQEGRVYLPQKNASGMARYWPEPQDGKPSGLIGFLLSIVNTMQNWHDEIQFPYPGFRDRIVQVSQRPDEGGLNLNMPRENIERLSDAGECAGDALVARFHPQGRDHGQGWQNHQRLRLRTFLGLVEELVRHPRINDPLWDGVVGTLRDDPYNLGEVQLGRDLLQGLRDLGSHMEQGAVSVVEEMPKPRPDMRVAPRV
jgi:hypothetical protein